ncbi:MAG: hypothetical protein II649_00850 [Kiritimatiellae bacterium]|nr:hypothetical protein [Kiritimatiellia bacterium]
MILSGVEERALSELQRGIPLCARPFEALSREVGCTEEWLVGFVERCRGAGVVRRFGAVFDTRRLGYRSVLCAVSAPAEEADAAAAKIVPLRGVTHCYLREPDSPSELPNLWFTLSYPAEVFDAMADEVRARLAPHRVHVLPATRRYKVDVVFGAASRETDERTEAGGVAEVSARDRAVIGALQGDTEVRPDYFASIAEKVGIREWYLLSTLELWRRGGRLKRIGLLLAHRKAGYVANGMCCWRVEGDTTSAGRALAARSEVTHCYERPLSEAFPYNLFAMVHCTSHEEVRAQHSALGGVLGEALGYSPDTVMLLSTREYKKTSMTFFAQGGAVL